MQQMQVTVPPGIGPGMPFAVNTPAGQTLQVVSPPDAVPGSPMLVNVPAEPQPMVGAPVVQEMMRVPQAAVSGAVVNFCVSDCTAGDELDDHRYWLAKDDLRDDVVPPALAAAGMTDDAWRQLHQDIDACNGKRFNFSCFLLLCCTTTPVGACCYCQVMGCAAKDAYLGICRRYESEFPQLMFKLTYDYGGPIPYHAVGMPPTGFPHPYGKDNTENGRGRFVFQIIVR